MRTIDRSINSTVQIQNLTITNSTFQNIFYELGSIVRLPQKYEEEEAPPFILNITNTNFHNMSFCGSILTNDFPVFEGTVDSYIEEYKNGIQNQMIEHYTRSPTQNITLNCTNSTTRNNETYNACYQIVFNNNTINGLNKYKNTPQNYFTEKVNWQMQRFGLAIHLNQFDGNLELLNNSFTDTLMNFNDVCIYQENPVDKTYYQISQESQYSASEGGFWTTIEAFYMVNQAKRHKYYIPY